ncbi:MAG TPA: GIY-YIG nuclease family protein [Terriglobia bacterium]|nr:GIY-YIG nuclease family protein [Terriglobia bacterium]
MDHKQLPNLTIEFLGDEAQGLRLVSQPNWSVECLISSRASLDASLGSGTNRKWLDAPGVYLLVGATPRGPDTVRLREDMLYVGQADSVADRLDSHLRNENKKWWRTALVLRRPDKRPLNISECRFMESRLCSLALDAGRCEVDNRVTPQPTFLAAAEQAGVEVFLEQALVIVSALGFDFFRVPTPPAQISQPTIKTTGPPPLPNALLPLLEQIRGATTGPAFPKAEWYSTRTPDYRAKIVLNEELFRVFARITWAKNWFWIELKDVGKYKVSRADEVERLRDAIEAAYRKAEQHLQRAR